MIRNIIFDIGNVLVAFQWDKKIRQYGYPEEVLERVAKATVLGDMWKEYDRGVLSESELMEAFIRKDPEIADAIRKCVGDYSGMLRMYDYTLSWIRELKQKGYRVFYLSNMPEIATRDCAKELAFTEETDGGILSYTERLVKPDPAIYQVLLDRYNLDPCECVFVDDSEKNIEAACQEGMHGIVFHSKEQVCEELRMLGVV